MERRKKNRLPYNDLELENWREYEEIWTDSLWHIPSRAKGNGHALEYHGNFVPQIATQTLLRYTRRDDVVLDLFLGAGTTALEAMRLGRRCVGVELQPDLVEQVRSRLNGAGERVRLLVGDSTRSETADDVRKELAALDRERADLLILHPPYHDIIQFGSQAECLSNARGTEAFLERFSEVARAGFELLDPGRFAVLVIGDKYEQGELVPLGFLCMQRMLAAGFRIKSIVVKNITGNEVGKGKGQRLWRYRALAGGFYIFRHEYVMIFQRPARRGARSEK